MDRSEYNYLFGPVPSRRLGRSLGVDLVPKKVCTLDCIYCESGHTTRKTTKRKEYIRSADIITELEAWFDVNEDPDYITFSGAGEPTLNAGIGDIIQHIKRMKPNLPVALITNGTLLSDPALQEELMEVDLLLPSLDAATQEVFELINRPDGALTAREHAEGLIRFSKRFPGKIWLEIFVVPGINDHEQEILALREVISQIDPDAIQLNTLDRPGTEAGMVPATKEELEYFTRTLDLPGTEIIAAAGREKKGKTNEQDVRNAILSTLSRRPCTSADLERSLGLPPDEIERYLEMLHAEKTIIPVEQERGIFYRMKD